MKTFLIERHIPGIGQMGQEELGQAAQKSNQVLEALGPGIEWVESHVSADKTFCVYLAENEEIIHEHAEKSGFPANVVTEVLRKISPATAKDAT